MCGCLSRVPYRGHDLAHNPGVCPDWELNWRPFGLQAGAQSAESHQPGLLHHTLKQLFKSELAFLITDKSFVPKIDSISEGVSEIKKKKKQPNKKPPPSFFVT